MKKRESLLKEIKKQYKEFIRATKTIGKGKEEAKRLQKLLQLYTDFLLEESPRKVVLINNQLFDFNFLAPALIFMLLHKIKNERNRVGISYAKVTSFTKLPLKTVRNSFAKLTKANFIKIVERIPGGSNVYEILEIYPEIGKIANFSIDFEILKEEQQVSPAFFNTLKKIIEKLTNRLSSSVHYEPSFSIKGLVKVGDSLIPHTILRTALVYAFLYSLRNASNISNISIRAIWLSVGVGKEGLAKSLGTLIKIGWIEHILKTRQTSVNSFKIIKQFRELDIIPHKEFNLQKINQSRLDPEYAQILVRICEDLAGISFSPINK